MKKLRVLTGRHAGAELILEPSTSVVSSDADHDIQITDWTEKPLWLTTHEDEDEQCFAECRLGDEGVDMTLADFAPRAFGPVVLCVGPATLPWPSDINLLESMLRPVAKAVEPPADEVSSEGVDMPALRGRRRWALGAGLVLAAGCLGAFVLVLLSNKNEPPPPTLLARTLEVLRPFNAPEVVARAEGDGVLVEGLVPDTVTANKLRLALATLPEQSVKNRVASAADLAQTMVDTMGISGISVNYLGKGEFVVQGAAVEAKKLHVTAERLANEMKPLVRGITVAVEELPPPARMPTGAMMRSDGVEYVQARDGTKHIALVHRDEPSPEAWESGDPFSQPRNSERRSQ